MEKTKNNKKESKSQKQKTSLLWALKKIVEQTLL
jgi:hypothetical protein